MTLTLLCRGTVIGGRIQHRNGSTYRRPQKKQCPNSKNYLICFYDDRIRIGGPGLIDPPLGRKPAVVARGEEAGIIWQSRMDVNITQPVLFLNVSRVNWLLPLFNISYQSVNVKTRNCMSIFPERQLHAFHCIHIPPFLVAFRINTRPS